MINKKYFTNNVLKIIVILFVIITIIFVYSNESSNHLIKRINYSQDIDKLNNLIDFMVKEKITIQSLENEFDVVFGESGVGSNVMFYKGVVNSAEWKDLIDFLDIEVKKSDNKSVLQVRVSIQDNVSINELEFKIGYPDKWYTNSPPSSGDSQDYPNFPCVDKVFKKDWGSIGYGIGCDDCIKDILFNWE